MDDDIDIEEHDVMDNPRIKSIFPDLSRVKIEIPDEEDVEDTYDDMELPPKTEEHQEMLYQNEYSFETMTEDIHGDNEEYTEENTYFYNNEIILGSKPPVDPEVLYQEALDSHPIVYLENWEERLKTSPCFCETCNILFPTVNALDAHKMVSHSYLIALDSPQKNTARKSTVPSKYCNHCSKTFPDDTSLIKHLYELLPLNNFPQVKEEKIEPDSLNVKSKLPASTSTPWPKKIKSTSQLITKIQPKKIKIEKEVKIEPKDFKSEVKVKSKLDGRYQKDGKFFAASSLVPKSTLFQCNVCQIGFVSCFSALQHSRLCEKSSPFEKCGVCKRKIRVKDAKIHKLQHNYNDKLKIYTVNKNIYDKILCECPKCMACFDELGFWAHYQKCTKSEKKTTYCTDCDMHIASTRYQNHRLKHSTKKLSKKDFILIQFHDQTNMSVITNNVMETMKTQRLEERKKKYRESKTVSEQTDNDITLYYCEFCGCCQYILNYKGHDNGACKNNISKKYCDKCGLCFSAKGIESHLHLHEKYTFSLRDIKIISLTSGKEIEPPIADLYKCKKCNKHFLYRRSRRTHNCKTEKFITCKICGKKFNLQAYKIHKIFHSVDKLIPELLKKYNSINSMWNIMFMCDACGLVTMTYDSAVSHSQGHLNFIISDFHKQCSVCDIRIAEKEYPLHEKLHSNNQNIKRESFKILKYNYEDLLKKEWMTIFKGLPKQDRQQILSKSIYRYTRSVKMHIELNASTDDYKYFCMNCNTFVEGPNINLHVQAKCSKTNKYVCSVCDEVFKTLKQFLSHDSHEKFVKPHSIITFNNDFDIDYNAHLNMIQMKSKTKNNTKDMPLSKLREALLDTTKKTYKIYKCSKCDTCVNLSSSIRKHRCLAKSEQRFCALCGQYFLAKKTSMHMEAHRKKPSITKDNLVVIYFNGNPKTKKIYPEKRVVAKIFECGCGLHFTSMKTIEKHLEECTPNLAISKETCSKCNLLFPTDVLVTHLVNHHSKQMKFKIEKIVKVNLWKCTSCALHFTHKASINEHNDDCDPDNGAQCNNCRLMFAKKCFPKHLCSNKDITYVNKITTVQKEGNSTTVFICDKCDICYSRRNSFMYHYSDVNHRLKKPPTPCKYCGLRFTNCSLQNHMRLHRKPHGDFKIKIVNPINGDVTFKTGNNSCDDDTDSKRSSPRKRKYDSLVETESALPKKEKLSPVAKVVKTPERKSMRKKLIDTPSTSKDDEIDAEFRGFDVKVKSTDNISDTDISDINVTVSENESEKTGISKKLKSRILVKGYSNKLYKCVSCQQHYMKEASFDYHAKNHRLQEITENYECDICHLDFSRYTLPRHKYVHHDNMHLTREDFVILTETPYSKESEILDRIESLKRAKNKSKNNSSENLDNTLNVSTDIDTTGTSDLNVSDANDTENVSDANDTENVSDGEKTVYYKCSDCNVCFVEHNMCYDHTLRHETINPMMYIECKICNFQFLIDSLKEHMLLHHNVDFKIEKLTIHEYKAVGLGLEPKIDVYQAIDKVQSRLISTTTDVGVV